MTSKHNKNTPRGEQNRTTLKRKVFVAMSGGVDSSVAALLLKEAGYDVVGVFMQGWRSPYFDCPWEAERQDAARAAASIGIPFRSLDVGEEYYNAVASYMIREYKEGRTPNPDVMCNSEIKFGVFADWAFKNGADYIATGHYARVSITDGRTRLLRGVDPNKDQSYFLWRVDSGVLARTFFPVGEMTKADVRAYARNAGLPNADKKDSQGVCFVGEGNMAEFLRHHIPLTPGEIHTTDGKIIGTHDGLELFTIGQRHGISVGGTGPYYVAAKEAETGTLIVASEANRVALDADTVSVADWHWFSAPEFPFLATAQIRYQTNAVPCEVHEDRVLFRESVHAPAPGQSLVIYEDDEVLGGGVIENCK